MTSRSHSPGSPPPDAVDDGQVAEKPPEDQEPPEQSTSSSSKSPVEGETAPSSAWQAIYSPQHNAYYFYNSVTTETTWINPLQPDSASPDDPSHSAQDGDTPEAGPSTSFSSPHEALQAVAVAAGIDPSLAHLDPTLAASLPNAHPSAFSYSARFNSRTGAFTKSDARDPTHLSEYERAKRMSEFYFDVGAWEKDVEKRQVEEEGEGKKRKRPTKKDLVRWF
jgi:hypothetical protein